MALPKIDTPKYEVILPVSKKKVNFRPFLVKEQKILLMAMESGESNFIQNNIKQVLQNCSIDEIDVSSLPMVDVEFYFLNLRAKSVGEIVETKYKCENEVDGKKCDNTMEVSYNILDVEVKMTENSDDIIKLTDSVGIKMKYPNFSVVDSLKDVDSLTDIAFELIIQCIDYIYDGDDLYYAFETPKEELNEFLDSLTKEQFTRIEKFIEDIPRIEKIIEMKCSKCGYEHKIVAKELTDFFI
jgi:hypothetical protein